MEIYEIRFSLFHTYLKGEVKSMFYFNELEQSYTLFLAQIILKKKVKLV